MCIAILNTKGKLSKETLKNSFDNNEMGAGLLWNANGKLNTFKTYKFKELLNKYNALRNDQKTGDVVLHFRIATSGVNGKENLHPFNVNDNLGFVHNGVISGLGNTKHSDTYQFNDILKGFKHDFLNCNTSRLFIANYIGSGSKLVFLDNKGTHTIINEAKGHWDKDKLNWYSNDSYKQFNDYKYYGSTKVYNTIKPFKYDYKIDTFSEEESYWDTFAECCTYYNIDEMNINSDMEIEYYCELNDCADVYELLTFLKSHSYAR
jgi:predicted glutamine amidotransferase